MTEPTIDTARYAQEITRALDDMIRLGERARTLRDLLTGQRRNGEAVALEEAHGKIGKRVSMWRTCKCGEHYHGRTDTCLGCSTAADAKGGTWAADYSDLADEHPVELGVITYSADLVDGDDE